MLQTIKQIYQFLFPKEPGRIEMLRFSKDRKGHRKNTLFTRRFKGRVFYGISRLNKSDIFNRDLGVNLAKERAEDSIILFKNYGKNPAECCSVECGMTSISTYTRRPNFKNTEYRWVPLSEVVLLLQYFRKLK